VHVSVAVDVSMSLEQVELVGLLFVFGAVWSVALVRAWRTRHP
jgi:hypothetical protein